MKSLECNHMTAPADACPMQMPFHAVLGTKARVNDLHDMSSVKDVRVHTLDISDREIGLYLNSCRQRSRERMRSWPVLDPSRPCYSRVDHDHDHAILSRGTIQR